MSVLEAKRAALVERLSLTINMLAIRQKEEPVPSERQRIGENIAIADQLLGELHKCRWVNTPVESAEASVQVALIAGATEVTLEALQRSLDMSDACALATQYIRAVTRALSSSPEAGEAGA